MLRRLPGIDIPAATEANILHAAAFWEFKQHVERLAREGLAYTCWMHTVVLLRASGEDGPPSSGGLHVYNGCQGPCAPSFS